MMSQMWRYRLSPPSRRYQHPPQPPRLLPVLIQTLTRPSTPHPLSSPPRVDVTSSFHALHLLHIDTVCTHNPNQPPFPPPLIPILYVICHHHHRRVFPENSIVCLASHHARAIGIITSTPPPLLPVLASLSLFLLLLLLLLLLVVFFARSLSLRWGFFPRAFMFFSFFHRSSPLITCTRSTPLPPTISIF